MKVLVCNKFYRPVGGPETIVFDTMRELVSLGHEAIPFAMSHPDNLPSEYADFFVPNVDYNTKQAGMLGRISEARNIIYNKEAKRRIEKLITATKPDIAHAHNIYHQLSPSVLVALREAGIPTILTLHDGKPLCANMLFLRDGKVCEKCAGKRFYHAITGRCVKNSLASSAVCAVEESLHRWTRIYEKNVDLIITPSRFLKDKLVEHKRFREDQIEVLYNYADTKSIQPDFAPGNYGLFFGRIEPHKGIYTLLDACKQLPHLEMMIAGRIPSLEDEKKISKTIEELNNIKMLGFQTSEHIKRLIRQSLFTVVPSECYENCPMVILEAQAAGKPVIASRIGGIPELIDDGVDGLLFEPGDAQGLVSCMKRIVENPELAREMGIRGRKKVERRFSIEVYMESLLNIYKRNTMIPDQRLIHSNIH